MSKMEKHLDLLNDDTVRDFFEIPANDVPSSNSDDINLGDTQNSKAKPSDFEFLKVIGKGSFGQVYLAKHKAENTFYAVKVLLKKFVLKRNETRHIMAEKSILAKNMNHPFLVALHYSFQTKDKLYFVLTYVNGGELFYHLQKEKFFPESRVRFYAAEIAIALGHLHKSKVIYRDLKPENILLDREGHIMLTDFGLCKEDIDFDGKTNTFCGTPEYLSPEILLKKPYDKSVDWWCLGCVIYELLFGLPPFYSKDTSQMYNSIIKSPVVFKANVSPATKSILEGFLDKNNKTRLGSGPGDDDVKKHEFFGNIDWEKLIEKKIHPPFVPRVTGDSDTKNIDTEFTREPVPESLIPKENALHPGNESANNAFLGFTYVPEDNSKDME